MTRSMTRWILAGLLAVGAAGATAQADPPENPFAGSWSGTWSAETGSFGTFDWTISDAGQIKGTVYSIPADHGGAVAGHVGAGGKLVFIGNVPADEPSEDGNGFVFKGMAGIDGDGKLVASATLAAPPFAYSLVAILEKN